MIEYNGDDLLKLFNAANIQLGNVHPNVVKAWFDTDCSQSKEILNWMCHYLSDQNIVAPHIRNEYDNLECPLQDDELEKEKNELEDCYPDIFDVDFNRLETACLKSQIDVVEEDIRYMNESLSLNKKISEELFVSYKTENKAMVESRLIASEKQKQCEDMADKLCESNARLHNQLKIYGGYLHTFLLDTKPMFLTNFTLSDVRKSFNGLQPMCRVLKNQDLCKTFFNRSSLHIENDMHLATIRQRIVNSKIRVLHARMKQRSLQEIKMFLEECNCNYILLTNGKTPLYSESVVDQKKSLINIVAQNIGKEVDAIVSSPQIQSLKSDAQRLENQSVQLKRIAELSDGVLSYLIIASKLFIEEKNNIASTYSFFKRVLSYIDTGITNSSIRMQNMQSIIDQFEAYDSKPFSSTYILGNLFNSLVSSASACSNLRDLKARLHNEQRRLFVEQPQAMLQDTRKMLKISEPMEKLLMSNTIQKILIMPIPLSDALSKVDEMVKEIDNITSSLMTNVKRAKNKNRSTYELLLRRLWVDFLSNPENVLKEMRKIDPYFDQQHSS